MKYQRLGPSYKALAAFQKNLLGVKKTVAKRKARKRSKEEVQQRKGKPPIYDTVFTKVKKYHRTQFMRVVDKVEHSGGDIEVAELREYLMNPILRFHPESVAFLFHLEGCPKNLLLFILTHKLDYITGRYSFKSIEKEQFREFSRELFGTEYSLSTVNQGHRVLVGANACICLSYGSYALNPLIAGGDNADQRRMLFLEYSRLLDKKGGDLLANIYPVFKQEKAKKRIAKEPEEDEEVAEVVLAAKIDFSLLGQAPSLSSEENPSEQLD